MHIDVHALQSVPYSNLNASENGAPKNCTYGGKLRTRVSSQSWKRAVREHVEHDLGAPAYRTRRIAGTIQDRLVTAGWDDELARKAGRAVMVAADAAAQRKDGKDGGVMPDAKTDRSGVLFWVPSAAIDELADLCAQHADAIANTALPDADKDSKSSKSSKDSKEKGKSKAATALDPTTVNDILARTSPTINLLGRMLAEMPGHNVDGATLFAHAFTVHEASTDLDFITAVDDLITDDDSGAGHMTTAPFTSGTFYRYSSVNVAEFVDNLDGNVDEALRAVDAYLRAFCLAMPGGRKRSTAATTHPDLVHITLRDAPRSLAGSFERPVRHDRDGGYMRPAQQRFDSYAGATARFLGDAPLWSGHAAICLDDPHAEFAHLGTDHGSIDALVQAAMNTATDHTTADGTAA